MFRLSAVGVVTALCVLVGAPRLWAQTLEVRVVVSGSSSVATIDPSNLRAPALRLMSTLLPPGAMADVRVFEPASKTSPSELNKPPSRAARPRVPRGPSPDLATALTSATADWTQPAPRDVARHLIVLTAGPPSEVDSTTAGTHSEQLTRCKALGIRVHVIAFAGAADRELLRGLANETDGWFETLENPAALARVFLHLSELIAAADALPLKGNQFTVDLNVKDLTLLVFHAPTAPLLEVTRPDGTVLNAATADASLDWHHEVGYDVLTLTAPRAGVWRFNAPADRDNRALVKTELALTVGALPTNILATEPVSVTAGLLEQGLALTRPDFLKLVRASAEVGDGAGEGTSTALALDPTSHQFVGELDLGGVAGQFEVLIKLDGGTFQRERHRRIILNGPPVSFAAEVARAEDQSRVIHLTVSADQAMINPATVSGLLKLTIPNTPAQIIALPALDGNEITVEIDAHQSGDYTLQPWVVGLTPGARLVKVTGTPIAVAVADGTPPPSAPAPVTAAPLVVVATPPPINWRETALLCGIGNAGLGSVVGGTWLALRQRRRLRKGLTA